MAKQVSFGSVLVGTTVAASSDPVDEQSDAPFRILVCASLSGQQRIADKPVLVDRDNLDDMLVRFRPSLSLAGMHPDGSAVEIQFETLDDFHPDRLYDRLDMFETLRAMRERLQNPATFAAAAEELRRLGAGGQEPEAGGRRPEARTEEAAAPSMRGVGEPAPISGGELLDQLLDHSEVTQTHGAAARQTSEFQRILAKIAEPHRIAADDPRKQELIGLVDALSADRMRAILHHPEFQTLESAWRGVHFLTRRVETDANLKIYLLDCSKAALAGDLEAVANLRESALYKLLVEQPAGAPPWTLTIGDFEFSAARGDVETLGRIAQIAAKAGAPFLAGASSSILGCPSIAAAPDPDDWPEPNEDSAAMWQQLRHLPQATSLGLAAPRFLLRLPYGSEASPLERFEYEEISAARHEDYLWGNPALACAWLLAQTFSETGWNMEGRLYRDLAELPVHLYDDDGQPRMKPCAEAVLLDRAVERILDFGIMPLQSFADRGAIRLVRLQSLADPSAALAGRWHS
jgi:type VI secretion system protein ImpC